MLRFLSIQNFVIVDKLELEFSGGFTALTGETGAGKSILIDALSLTLGERADAGVVREGTDRSDISAEFDVANLPDLQSWLRENDLAGDDGVCLLRRVIDSGGKSRGYINGSTATLQQMRGAGEYLLDIHGQNAHQSLLRGDAQRGLLDAYADQSALAQQVADAWRRWQKLRERRTALEKNAAAIIAEREQLDWQVRELDALKLTGDEWGSLQADHSRLAHAASLLEAVQAGLESLSESDNAALAQINAVISRLQSGLQHDAGLQNVLDLLQPAQIQLQEAVHELTHYAERLDLDPAKLQALEERLSALHAAARKYRVAPAALPELLATWKLRQAELGGDLSGEALAQEEKTAQADYATHAKKLSAGRNKAAKKLSEQVTAAMQSLAMSGGEFAVALTPLETGNAHGLEHIEFQVAAHAGTTPRPLAKVASGGELSRISLAIQVITSRVAAVPTLIFDEVDAGIGGRVAEIVGGLLKKLGGEHQVLCVTHLPQVAARADAQWQVSKAQTNGSTLSQIRVLKKDERIEEIARMLGGIKITETTRKHAAEMLGLK